MWVIALGTNDVTKYAATEFAALIAKLLEALPPDGAGVVWVTDAGNPAFASLVVAAIEQLR